ncbi:NADH-quinone oxidoreductase subunit G [Ornithinimicrobium cerasi]|uniref:NADH-quinone oxidoreductase subunit G n=1 Tax=Ornithinimicrobium cerasi TaxID=2248773 RepID=UPI000EFE4BC3|nr:NADH-quinone oxidoreductase subunit G [Ornithinimicrobium cerasi]
MSVSTSPAAGGNSVTDGGDASTSFPAEPDVTMVELTIDDVPVSVPEGTLVIRAAEHVGIHIPRFCDHPLLDPVGACRQCLVDVATPDREGTLRPMPKPQASCTMVVSPGMQVRTQDTSPVADKAQHGVMELLLINHPLDCPVCDKGGECPLQNQAMSNGRPTSRFEDVKRTFPKPVNISSQVLLDRERCVLCARCTRFSDQVAGDPFIALIERGALQQVGIYEEKPFESYFSGNTVQICPVGALTGAAYRFRSRPFDLVSTPSVCEHCASGCSLRTDHRRGAVLRRMALDDPEVNEEWNCDKGRWAFTYPTLADRLREPVVRGSDGEYAVTPWRTAYQAAAAALSGARAAGVLVGGRVSVEDAYAYAKLARVALGTNDVDHRARPHSAEEAAFLASSVVGARDVSYATLEKAPSVLLVGLEPEDESPIVFLRLRKAVRRSKTQVYGVAPFATRGLTKLSGTLLASAPGTEAEVLQALSAHREQSAARPVDGPAEPLPAAALDEGTSEYTLAADSLTEGSVILVGERLATVPGALSAAAALAERTGSFLAWVPRRAGERGAVEVGALPGLLPGGHLVGDAAARATVAGAWRTTALPEREGRDTTAILEAAAHGEIDVLVVGGVEIDDLPDPELAREALRRAFVVSLEVRETEVHAYADVILPVAPQQEKSGAYANWEGRLRLFEQALDSSAQSDHVVLDRLADAMGVRLGTESVQAVRRELTALGTSASRPPAPTVAPVGPAAPAAGEAVLATWHHLLDEGSLQDGEPFLAGTAPQARARVSAGTAAALGVGEDDLVTVSTDRGSIVLPVSLTAMHDGVVWVPTNSTGSTVRATLGVDAGAVVRIAAGAPGAHIHTRGEA